MRCTADSGGPAYSMYSMCSMYSMWWYIWFRLQFSWSGSCVNVIRRPKFWMSYIHCGPCVNFYWSEPNELQRINAYLINTILIEMRTVRLSSHTQYTLNLSMKISEFSRMKEMHKISFLLCKHHIMFIKILSGPLVDIFTNLLLNNVGQIYLF